MKIKNYGMVLFVIIILMMTVGCNASPQAPVETANLTTPSVTSPAETAEPTATPTPEPTLTPEPTPEIALTPINGQWDGLVYTNSMLQLKLTATEDWEVMEVPTEGIVFKSDYDALVKKAQDAYDSGEPISGFLPCVVVNYLIGDSYYSNYIEIKLFQKTEDFDYNERAIYNETQLYTAYSAHSDGVKVEAVPDAELSGKKVALTKVFVPKTSYCPYDIHQAVYEYYNDEFKTTIVFQSVTGEETLQDMIAMVELK